MNNRRIAVLSLIIAALMLFGCAKPAETPQEISMPAETPAAEEHEAPAEAEGEDEPDENTEEESFFEIPLSFIEGEAPSLTFSSTDLDNTSAESADIFAAAKVTMVNIWGTFCAPCRYEMPFLGEISEEYADKDFQIIGVLMDVNSTDSSTADLARELAADSGVKYRNFIATEDVIANIGRKFNVTAIPTTFFVDSEGKLICKPLLGSSNKPSWANAVDRVLEHVGE